VFHQAVLRLKDGGISKLQVDIGNTVVCAIIESAIHPYGPIDTVDHSATWAAQHVEACDIKVEGIKEAGLRGSGNRVAFDPEPAFPHFVPKCPHELVSASGGRGRKFMENRNVKFSSLCKEAINL